MVLSKASELLTLFTQESAELAAVAVLCLSVMVFLLVFFPTLYARGVESC